MDGIKPCCENREDRELVEVRGAFTVERCQVCLCRHFILALDLAALFPWLVRHEADS